MLKEIELYSCPDSWAAGEPDKKLPIYKQRAMEEDGTSFSKMINMPNVALDFKILVQFFITN